MEARIYIPVFKQFVLGFIKADFFDQNTRWKALYEIYLRLLVMKMAERKNGTRMKREK